MTRDEHSANFQDALGIAAADSARIAAHLRARTNGADLKHLLIAAIDVTRDLIRRIAGQRALEESEAQQDFLKEEDEELHSRFNDAIDAVHQAAPHGGDAIKLPIHTTADHPKCAVGNISRLPHEDYLIEQLNRQLLLSTLDGTEGHGLLEKFAAAVLAADGDSLRIHSALFDAKQHLRALLADTVPREAVNNAVCLLWKKMR